MTDTTCQFSAYLIYSSHSNAGESSLQRAKSNIEKYYSVVGMLEDFPNFFKTLEYIFPQYFAGAIDYYNSKYKMELQKLMSLAKFGKFW